VQLKKQPIQTFLYAVERSKYKNSFGETIILLEWNPKDYLKNEIFLDYDIDEIASFYKEGSTNYVIVEFSRTSRDSCLYLIALRPRQKPEQKE